MNFNIDINKIISDFYKRDVKGLFLNKQFKLSTNQKKDLILISKSYDSKDIFNELNNFFNKHISGNNYELCLMMTLITQRYNYFYQTEIEWNKFFQSKVFLENSEDLKEKIFIFFEKQIDIYSVNYLNIINGFNVNQWNTTFYKKLKSIFDGIVSNRLIDEKIKKIDEFIDLVKNTKYIYSSLEGIGVEIEKQKFLSNTNEIKIIFQSMKDLLDRVLRKIELN
ncbi:hypothetical protein SCORR_v1c04910 [Spiroplasma corruscae]|uniref:Uncharacterized protein n=1 Tax=Spiroplasma corruscae TaxID=216934 RepID=A0A222EPP1_9MOLU|nr:hypothetical protein [Spiroplasma corruscae]ASP28263.1 hypothetical protein SCORR_v1c04910 [Spiroplasma corruscae]